jgi:SAM-dependent methyltransferase
MLKFFPKHPQRIIDIGCGDGFFLNILAKKGYRADGIDASAEGIKLCRERIGNSAGHIECCFIEEFKPVEPYDLLLCGEVLEHIQNDQAFLEEINRLAIIQGVLILTVPLDMRLWSKADEDAGHFRRYTKPEIFTKLESAGFSISAYEVWGFPLTRYLTPYIRTQQTEMMSASKSNRSQWKKQFFKKYKSLLKPLKFIFLIDNLFNFTGKGAGIVIKAIKTREY